MARQQAHQQGDNFVVVSDIRRTNRRSLAGAAIQFLNLDGLIARLGGGKSPLAGVSH